MKIKLQLKKWQRKGAIAAITAVVLFLAAFFIIKNGSQILPKGEKLVCENSDPSSKPADYDSFAKLNNDRYYVQFDPNIKAGSSQIFSTVLRKSFVLDEMDHKQQLDNLLNSEWETDGKDSGVISKYPKVILKSTSQKGVVLTALSAAKTELRKTDGRTETSTTVRLNPTQKYAYNYMKNSEGRENIKSDLHGVSYIKTDFGKSKKDVGLELSITDAKGKPHLFKRYCLSPK